MDSSQNSQILSRGDGALSEIKIRGHFSAEHEWGQWERQLYRLRTGQPAEVN